MQDDRPRLYTIGHSTHTFEEFVQLLKRHNVNAVADVRSQPYSRWTEHFNRERFAADLAAVGIRYVFLGEELGARRDEVQSYEMDRVSYERIVSLPRFQDGLNRLRQGSHEYRIAVMCSEKEPLDCHRTVLICRQLRGEFHIQHILADGNVEEHEETERRMVRAMDITRTLFEPDLTEEDMIQQAYDKRGRQIAFRRTHEGSPL